MQIGCCAPIEKYAQIVSDGYDYVEFPAWEVASLTEAQLQAVIQSIEEKGVPCLRLNAYCKGTPAIVGEGYSRESALRYAENLMEKAARLHVRCVGIGAPSARNIPEGFDRALADKQCEEFLRTTAEVAAGYGIQILVEAVQRGMCNYMNRTEEALRMAETLDMDNVGLVVDLYHMQTENEDWDTLGTYVPRMRHMHVSTVGAGLARGLYGPEDAAECERTFRAIAESGYRGTVSIEPDAPALTPEATQTALQLMREACRRCGISDT